MNAPSTTASAQTDQGWVVISSFREAEEILRRQRDFLAHGGKGALAAEFVDRTVIDLDGDAHASQRRLLAKVVSSDSAHEYLEVLQVAFIRYLAYFVDRGERTEDGRVLINLVDVVRATFWHLGTKMVGIDDVESPERLKRLQELILAALEGVTILFTLKDPQEVVESARLAMSQFATEFFDESLDRRRRLIEKAQAGTSSQPLPNDAVTQMLLQGSMPDDVILRQCVNLMGASTSNTVNVTCYALIELGKWLQSAPDADRAMVDPALLAHVVDETIRLHRTGARYVLRRAVADTRLQTSSREIPAGTVLALDFGLADRDATVFGPDADAFEPHRDLAEARVKQYGLGFGSGPHACLARRIIAGDGSGSDATRLVDVVLTMLIESDVRIDADREPGYESQASPRFEYLAASVGNAEPLAPAAGRGHGGLEPGNAE